MNDQLVALAIAMQNVDEGVDNPYKCAEAAVKELQTDRFVTKAVEALKADGWEETHEGPLGIGTLSDEDLANIARAVLRSVGGDR